MTRLSLRILLAVAALLAVASPPAAAQTTTELPDLYVHHGLIRPAVVDMNDPNDVFLRALRFNGFIANKAGAGPLEVRGSAPQAEAMQDVVQRVFSSPVQDLDLDARGGSVYYDRGDGHLHWHIGRAARYALYSLDGSTLVAPAAKVGFCLTDTWNPDTNEELGPYSGTFGLDCENRNPGATEVVMGLSAGWVDIYGRGLWYQWVDISNVAPGTYLLRTEVDPDDLVEESDEINVPFDYQVNVPGWVSNPVSATLADSGPTTVSLDVDPVPEVRDDGDPWNDGDLTNEEFPLVEVASPEYRIEDPPEHGTLDQPTGVWFSGATLQYTPTGAPVADSFTYSVREAGSQFPTSPPRTAVTLAEPAPPDEEDPPPTDDEDPQPTAPTEPAGGSEPPPPPSGTFEQPPLRLERVAISGAPAEMVAGTSVQLTATVLDSTSPTVRWSATAGRITPDGVFTASRTRPSATIRATAAGGAFAETVIRFVAAKRQQPLPTACARSARLARSARAKLGRVCIRYVRRALMVSATPRSAGRLVVALRRGRKVLKRCRFRAAKGRHYGCSVKVRRSRRLATTVVLKRRGKVLRKRLAVR